MRTVTGKPICVLPLFCNIGNCILQNAKAVTLFVGFLLLFLFYQQVSFGQTTRTVTFKSSGTWTVPADVTQITVEVWGAGGGGGGNYSNKDGAGGGGGGGYSRGVFSVTAGNTYTITVGQGGNGGYRGQDGSAGGSSWFGSTSTLLANGGNGGKQVTSTGGVGGTGGAVGIATGTGAVTYSGGNGAAGKNNNYGIGGGSGSSAGTAANGNSASNSIKTYSQAGATAPTGGGDGAAGGSASNGVGGMSPGGGGSGAGEGWSNSGGNGADGQVKITFTSSLPESFWYKADTGVSGTSSVTNWADQAGNNNNATNSGDVSLVTNSINFNPSLSFSDVDRQFPVSNTLTVQSFIIVSKIPATGNDLSGLSGANGDKGIRLSNSVNALGPNITPFQSWRGDNNTDDWVNTTNGGTGRINGVIDANMLHSSEWHIANLSRYQALTGDYYIGGYYSGRSYTGEIAEVMAFSGAVVNQNQVESYMAVKYGISLPGNYYASNGVTTWSTTSGFQNDIHGIGRDDNYGLNQLSSKSENPGTDILTIQSGSSFVAPTNAQTGTALSDKQFFITGHNSGSISTVSTLSTGINTIARKWYAQTTNMLPTESFQFNLTGTSFGSYCKIGVLIADDASFSVNRRFVEGTVNSSTLTVNDLAITGNKYFTVATLATPTVGEITANQEVCSGSTPETITSLTDGTGFGSLTYQWESSTDGSTWNTISGATNIVYSPGALTATTQYRRKTVATLGAVFCTSIATTAVTVIVGDTEPPVASCVSSLSVNVDANGEAVITPAMIDNGSTDNCGIDTMWVSPEKLSCSGSSENSTGIYKVSAQSDDGGTTVTVTFTNIKLNLSQQYSTSYNAYFTFDYNIEVAGTPVINFYTKQLHFYLNNSQNHSADLSGMSGSASSSIFGLSGTYSSDISVEDVTTSLSLLLGFQTQSYSQFSNTNIELTSSEEQLVTLTVIDNAGNTSTCQTLVSVNDVLAPIPDQIELPDITAECEVTTLTAPTATDNCLGEVTGTTSTVLPITSQGTTTVTWTYEDGNGNTSSQTQNVIIDDVTDPDFTCPTATTVVFDASCQITIPDLLSGMNDERDNCGTPILSQSPVAGTVLPSGAGTIHHVTITADDGNGNTTNCDVKVSGVADTEIDIEVQDLANFCQSGQTGTTTVTWTVNLLAGTSDWTYGYTINDGTTDVASATRVSASGDITISYTVNNSVLDKTYTLTLNNVKDNCGLSETGTINNSDAVTVYAVPATGEIIPD